MNIETINDKLSNYPIDEIAARCEFNRRSDAKVTMLAFIGSFMVSLNQGHSLKRWACRLSDLLAEGISVTKAGLQKRLGLRQLKSAKALLREVIKQNLTSLHETSSKQGLFNPFGQVLLEDSVCVKLNKNLAEALPGGHSNSGSSATARVQVCLELKSLAYKRFKVTSYRENDQSFSKKILRLLRVGDLVIRDLGYWSLACFEAIAEKGAFFLSRYKPDVGVYLEGEEQKLELVRYLKKLEAKGETSCDLRVRLGKSAQLPARLVAIRCPDDVAEARIRKAKKDRHSQANHSKAYFELLKWTIYVTNVSAEVWKKEEIMAAYRFRWHIEMVFKVWKSKFDLQELMDQAQIKKPIHAELFFYLFLLYLTLFYMAYFYYFYHTLYRSERKVLSLFGFAEFLKLNFLELIEAELQGTQDQWIPALAREANQELRKDRIPQLLLFMHYDRPNPCCGEYSA